MKDKKVFFCADKIIIGVAIVAIIFALWMFFDAWTLYSEAVKLCTSQIPAYWGG